MEAVRASGDSKPSVMIQVYSSSSAAPPSGPKQAEAESSRLFSRRPLQPLDQIKGPSGSVRGHRDVVKRSLANLRQPLGSFGQLELADELGCVAYTTSLGVVRRTADDSRKLRAILELNMIRYRERDVYLNQEYRKQLQAECGGSQGGLRLPLLVVDGRQVGGVKELEALNEAGAIQQLLARFKMSKPSGRTCTCCGNARFIACQSCHGSRRSAVHHFRLSSVALRCIKCDTNEGLVACPACLVAEEEEDEEA